MNNRKWYVNRAQRKIAGVCAGLASVYEQPLWAIRALTLLLGILFPLPVLLAYSAAAVLLPARWVE